MSLARLPPGDQSRVSGSTATPLTRPLLTSPGARGKRIWTLNRKKKKVPHSSTEKVGRVVSPQPLKLLCISKEKEGRGVLSDLRSWIWGPRTPR